MKKLLLLASLAMIVCLNALAATDGQTYEAVNGLKFTNLWAYDRVHNSDVFSNLDANNTRARTAVMSNGVVYVSRSEAVANIQGTDTISQSVIYRFNALTGEEMPALAVTLNGAPYGAFLGVNSIGVDNFGHLWVAPYTSETAQSIPFYSLDGETGEITLITNLDKGDMLARTDYYDVMGDITREEAECNIMNAATNVATVYRWHADQGSDDFEGGFEGDISLEMTDFYPASATQWAYGPYVKMILGEDEETLYSGELFYIDGFQTTPNIYDNTGSMIDSFEPLEADHSELVPELGTNGVAEFQLDGRNFIIYSMAQYSGDGHGCQSNIAELGEGMSLEGLTKYWQMPADSLGKMSDGGNRIHCYSVQYGTDSKGNDMVTILNFKSYNGIGVYTVTLDSGDEPGLVGDLNNDGVVDASDVSTLIAVITGTATSDSADVNGDGAIDAGDVTKLIAIILGN